MMLNVAELIPVNYIHVSIKSPSTLMYLPILAYPTVMGGGHGCS